MLILSSHDATMGCKWLTSAHRKLRWKWKCYSGDSVGFGMSRGVLPYIHLGACHDVTSGIHGPSMCHA